MMRWEKVEIKKREGQEECRDVLYGIPQQQTKFYGQLLEIRDR